MIKRFSRFIAVLMACLSVSLVGGVVAAQADGGPYYGNYQVTDGAGVPNQFQIYWDSNCPGGAWGIQHRWYNGSWTPWYDMGGCSYTGLDVGKNYDGRLEIFVIGTDSSMWHRWQTCAGCGWSGWSSLGVAFLLPGCHSSDCVGWAPSGHDQGNLNPRVVSALSGWSRMAVFGYGYDSQRWENSQNSAGCCWSGWYHG